MPFPARVRNWSACGVLAIVYGRAKPPLDVNMARFLGSFECAEVSPERSLCVFVLRLVSDKRSLEVSWTALDFGALVCRARHPLCPQCSPRTGTSIPCRGSVNLLPPQKFFQANEALVADDDVVDEFDVEDAASLHELFRRLDILC
jgi:adenine-specific DNA glycosylase